MGALLRQLRSRGSRGAAELGVVAVVASLAAGLLVGNGLTRTAVDVADGVTWLSDQPLGEVVQINPATGQPEVRLGVGAAGDGIAVAQQDGRLVVVNQKTGMITNFDLATLLASGQRQARAGKTEVVLSGGSVFVVDKERGTVANVDPVSLATVGALWTAPGGLADAVADDSGTLWALTSDGRLYGLTWSSGSLAFDAAGPHRIEGSGVRSQLVPHQRGVTVFGPDNGVVVQVGTGRDVVAGAPHLDGPVTVASRSPRDLVPASSAATSTVVIVGKDAVREVNVAGVGCTKPGTPEVYRGQIYVPCQGARKVIRLDRDGRRVGDDIITPQGGDPQLVLDDGRMLINVPGADSGVEVRSDGSTRTFRRHDPRLPRRPIRLGDPDADDRSDRQRRSDADHRADSDRDADHRRGDRGRRTLWIPPTGTGRDIDTGRLDRTIAVPSDLFDPTTRPTDPDEVPPDPTGTEPTWPIGPPTSLPTSLPTTLPTSLPTTLPTTPPTTRPTSPGQATVTEPSQSTDPTTKPPDTPPPVQPEAPAGVAAAARADSAVDVSWQHSGPVPDRFTVVQSGTTQALATVPGNARAATVSGIAVGTATRFEVVAHFPAESLRSAPSGAVTPYGRPGQVTGITTELRSRTASQATVSVSWNAAADHGRPVTGYRLVTEWPGGSRTTDVPMGGTGAQLQLPCADGCDAATVTNTVAASNEAGEGPAASASSQLPSVMPAVAYVVDSHSRVDPELFDTKVDVTIGLRPPHDWATFIGECRLEDRPDSDEDTDDIVIPCDATQARVPIERDSAGEKQTDPWLRVVAKYNGRVAVSHEYGWTQDWPTG